jgi:hypothetical protein
LSCPRAEGAILGQIREVTKCDEREPATQTDELFTMLHLTVPTGPEPTLESLIHESRLADICQNRHDHGQITRTGGTFPPIFILALDRLRWVLGVQKKSQACVRLPTTVSSSAFIDTKQKQKNPLAGILSPTGAERQ